ncbi:MAG: YHS domain-containing protein [Chloroflexota bacterium]|nr:YHS domain-containing protein [Chloroflexota bacterium]MDE3193559.1 YHS domain-containing protein [Chloroflexota bacterium]
MTDETVNTAEVETSDEIGTDPVCGMPVDVEIARESDLVSEYADRQYAFCGRACRDRFLAEPIAYAIAGRDAP